MIGCLSADTTPKAKYTQTEVPPVLETLKLFYLKQGASKVHFSAAQKPVKSLFNDHLKLELEGRKRLEN